MRYLKFLFCFLAVLSFSFAVHATNPDNCRRDLEPEPEISQTVARLAESELKKKGFLSREARGYSILIATMVASAATTTYLSSSLPPNFQFVSHFLAQVSTLGVFVFGAPIWEPLASAFRKMAFGVRKQDAQGISSEITPAFESQWRRTQETYSLNAQMSRNVIGQFLVTVHQNFYEAHRAMIAGNPTYSADQVAAAAFRLRTLYRDIEPNDPSVAAAVRTAFTNHIQVDADFVKKVESNIKALDKSYSTEEAQAYYHQLFKSWFGLQPERF